MTIPERHGHASGLDPVEICTLSSEGLRERIDWIRGEILPHALASERTPEGIVVELVDRPEIRDRLDQLIELERDCCDGIVYTRTASDVPGRVRLEIRGIDPNASLFADLGRTAGGRSRNRRIAGALGGGLVAGLLVCCILPLAAVALLGVAAEPLLRLDAPGPIATTAALASVAIWVGLGRRKGAEQAACCDPGR